jgi:outer membrane protein assembly factor BamB
MFCRECGAELADGTKHCDRCGAASVVPQQDCQRPARAKWRRFILTGMLLLVLVGAAAFLFPTFFAKKGLAAGTWSNRRGPYSAGQSPIKGPDRPAIKWTFDLCSGLPSEVRGMIKSGQRCLSSPVIGANGTIFAGCYNRLRAVSPSGRESWHRDMTAPIAELDLSPPEMEFLRQSGEKHRPVVVLDARISSDGTILISTQGDNRLSAFMPNGNVKWQTKVGSVGVLDNHDTAYTSLVEKTGDSESRFICAIAPDGKTKWRLKLDALPNAIDRDGTIYACNGNDIYAITLDGRLRWHTPTDGILQNGSPLTVGDNCIIVASVNEGLSAYSKDGSRLWNLHLGGYVIMTALGQNGTIYASEVEEPTQPNEKVYLCSISPAGKLNWKVKSGRLLTVDGEGTLYVNADDSNDHNLYALTSAGTTKWKIELGGHLARAPAIGNDGTLYVLCDNGCLYALGEAK